MTKDSVRNATSELVKKLVPDSVKETDVYKRLTSDTPKFWRIARKWALIGTVVLSGATLFAGNMGAPVLVTALLGALDAMCGATILNASLTTTSKKLSDK